MRDRGEVLRVAGGDHDDPGVGRRPPRPRLVTVTPAGRRRYVEILANYLLRNRHLVAEHQWWVNTRVPEDVAYLLRLSDRYPDFFRIVIRPHREGEPLGHAIWRFMSTCIDPGTVYLRLDDDICYVAEHAIAAIYEQRLADPRPFLVLGNIVNNAICSHFHQAAGLIPRRWGTIGAECMDRVGWNDGFMAVRIHRWFQELVRTDRVDVLAAVPFPFDGRRRFSINAICWNGSDMAALPERDRGDVDEEPFLTVDVPNRLDRPNVICPRAIFGHFAFYTQRPFIEAMDPGILRRYGLLSGTPDASGVGGSSLGAEFGVRVRTTLGRTRLRLRRLESAVRRFVRSVPVAGVDRATTDRLDEAA